jgi:mitochondrial fission protein ELM1
MPPLFNIFTTNAAMRSSDNTQSVKTRIKSFFNDNLLIDNRIKKMTGNINVICEKLSENQWLFESVEKQKLYLDHLFHFQLAVIGTTIQYAYTKNKLNNILDATQKSLEETQRTFLLRRCE